ncbi:hypothetical protein CSC66_08670 [Pseudoxanthomonas kaohsiungensis]|nr:hypothetical protein CSC66_08670 [Pseudoxanthomonas kaohsiungensis]
MRFPERSHALLFEVADACGSSQSRFADAIAIGLWPSHGHRLDGMEIKVSRGDFLREMKDPTKSEPIYQFCHRYWLCCPKGMVQPSELPETWGLLEFSGGSLREKKKATVREPVAPSYAFVASLLRRHAGQDEQMLAAHLKAETARIHESLKRSADVTIEREISMRVRRADEAATKLVAIKEATGIDLTSFVPTQQWIEAIRFLHANPSFAATFTRRGLARLREQAEQLSAEIGAVIDGVPE